ncbi:methyltransferase domain-containing protein [bacterium]|nr:methyltransferase domain-containing protein [bacterium]
MAIVSLRLNKNEEKILKFLTDYFEEDKSTLIKEIVKEKYEDIIDRKYIAAFEAREDKGDVQFFTAKEIKKNATKQFYDLTAEETAEKWYNNPVLMPTIQEFVSLLNENPRVLDLGCGTGHDCMRLSSLGAEVVGIDFSAECIKIARERCKAAHFEVIDFFELDDRFGLFDGVIAYASLIHVAPSGLPTILGKVANIIRDGGFFEVIMKNGTGIKEITSTVKGIELTRTAYLYNRSNLVSHFSSSGFLFFRKGYLDKSLVEKDWRCYIFRKRK